MAPRLLREDSDVIELDAFISRGTFEANSNSNRTSRYWSDFIASPAIAIWCFATNVSLCTQLSDDDSFIIHYD